jgi:hypothetical protein
VDNTVLTLHSEQFSQRIQHDIQQAAKSFNEKSTQVETAKKEWHRQAREIILNLNEKDESSAFSSIKEIENRAQERVDQVMPKIGDLRAKFNQR